HFTSLLRLSHPPISTLFPYTTLFRSHRLGARHGRGPGEEGPPAVRRGLPAERPCGPRAGGEEPRSLRPRRRRGRVLPRPGREPRSEEHTSELQSQSNLVCRLLLEKKK